MKKELLNILLVEDDPNLGILLVDYLDLQGYRTIYCKDGKEGLEAFRAHSIDLCILDVMMPKIDGFTLAIAIRKENQAVPVIFLTARALDADRVKGFKIGCDDYITKPFSSEELSLRIKAILKRCSIGNAGNRVGSTAEFHIDAAIFDHSRMEIRAEGETISLTKKESELLKFLCEHPDELLSREAILMAVWGSEDYFIGRSMDVFITKLRKYLRSVSNIQITNVHGVGFIFEQKSKK
ncbi:MAG: response regulator transcription factor [Bacteroidales bacterium]|nr:response regulator transcription factor [Bacteroidales bacterium]